MGTQQEQKPLALTLPLEELFAVLHESLALSSPEEIKDACDLIARVQRMTSGERDTLRCAFEKGPLWDGDVPSKSDRDQLLCDEFIAKVVVKGEEGFNACTYLGARAYRLLMRLILQARKIEDEFVKRQNMQVRLPGS